MNTLYQPPRKYRTRLFSPLGWMIVTVLSVSALLWIVGVIWVIDMLRH